MIRLVQKSDQPLESEVSVTLTLDQRVRSRLRVDLDDGREAGILLERSSTLRDGDCLVSDEGLVVRVRAGAEALSSVRCEDPLLLARACYHLGNRHVALQIQPGMLRYQHDHVLDEMLRGLGLTVALEQVPFEPEPGAYDGGHTGHGHHQHGD
ncbi:urease accessory protein UreE [Thiorhodococcus mannitoliphagus]|uniref:Urease accessory protein UreE n=1 Tax=Thiorhodococcus mannitoliphagus TaxID=329406 RepID=A0A6P1DNW2_9GAMM|nr:urease accessory protein UreE [Thiorhodococcus mannitoliphagus]NEX19230.1 urease accessory protein UreE [Thiorhodococcus mannitoliphagus]